MSLTFGLVAEGKTDHPVLAQVLRGKFPGRLGPNAIRPRQPLTDETSAHATGTGWGGWMQVFAYLKNRIFENDLATLDYLIVQIDADCCEDKGFDVPRRENGLELDVQALVRRIIRRLRREAGCDSLRLHGKRILFAVAVNEIECWLLPLWESQPAKQKATLNCTARLFEAQKSRGEKRSIRKDSPETFRLAAEQLAKPAALRDTATKQESLATFVKELDRVKFPEP